MYEKLLKELNTLEELAHVHAFKDAYGQFFWEQFQIKEFEFNVRYGNSRGQYQRRY